jgi:hypothetical protein
MAKLIGTDPNQVPTNADLGSAAYMEPRTITQTAGGIWYYENKTSLSREPLTVDITVGDSNIIGICMAGFAHDSQLAYLCAELSWIHGYYGSFTANAISTPGSNGTVDISMPAPKLIRIVINKSASSGSGSYTGKNVIQLTGVNVISHVAY